MNKILKLKRRSGIIERKAAFVVFLVLIVARLSELGRGGCFKCAAPDCFALSLCFLFPWRKMVKTLIPVITAILSDWSWRRWIDPSPEPYCIALCVIALIFLSKRLKDKVSDPQSFVRNLNPVEVFHDYVCFKMLAIWLIIIVLFLGGIPREIPAACAVMMVALHLLKSYSTHPLSPAIRVESEIIKNMKSSATDTDPVTDIELFNKVCDYMETHRPFLVESFTIKDLASAVITNKCYLSRTINGCSGHNFRYFLNTYRVRYAMNLFMGNPSFRISELWQLSGFGSESTFSSAFKLIMKESPSSWIRRMKMKSYNG